MSCLLRVSTPLKSNFKPLFSSRNRLRALSDTISLLAGRFHAGHKNAYRVHAHRSACTLVAGTQEPYGLQRAQLQDQEASVLSQINVICTPTSYVFADPSKLGPLQCFSQVLRLM